MTISSHDDLGGLQAIGKVVATALEEMRQAVKPGMTTAELDRVGNRVLRSHGAQSAPIVTYDFPGVTCISINDEAAHGIPSDRIIQQGDLVKIDVSAELDGYFADAAITVPVGEVSALAQRLMDCAKAAFYQGLAQVKPGGLVRNIGKAVEAEVKQQGFGVLCQLPGHGIGKSLHEEPTIPMCYQRRMRDIIENNMVFTIEPHISARKTKLAQEDDGWTLTTHNGSLSAAFEHTVVVTPNEPLLITTL